MPETGMPALRSLADDLRQRPVDSLALTLSARPDLLNPIPADIRELALRAGSTHSVSMALDRLNALELAVLEVASAIGSPCPDEEVVLAILATSDLGKPSRGGSDADAVTPQVLESGNKTASTRTPLADATRTALQRLRVLALVWGRDEVNVVRAAAEAFGSYPCGLYPPLAQHLPAYRKWQDPTVVTKAVASCSTKAREFVEELLWNGPTREVPHASRVKDTAGSAWGELVHKQLVHVVNENTLALPREVALALRGGAWVQPQSIHLDPAAITQLPPASDMHAATALLGIRRIAEVVEAIHDLHPKVSRTKQVRKADLASIAQHLGTSAEEISTCIGLALATGLIGVGGVAEDALAVTARGSSWLASDSDAQWWQVAESLRDDGGAVLAAAHHGVVDRGRLPSHEVDWGQVLVQEWLRFLAEVSTEPTTGALVFSAHRPRIANRERDAIARCSAVCTFLGLSPSGGGSDLARFVIERNEQTALDALKKALPPEVSHFVVQSDHTVVVPGRPVTAMRDELLQISDLISHDYALVLRVSPTKLRIRLAGGATADEILDFLTKHSHDPLPQSLVYLVNDCARPRTAIRVESPATVLSIPTDEDVSRIAKIQELEGLGLRRIDEHTFVSPAAPLTVAKALDSQGFATDISNLPETSSAVQPSPIAARPWSQPRSNPEPVVVARVLVNMTVATARIDEPGKAPDGAWVALSAASLRTRLTDAAASGEAVFLEFADANADVRVMHVTPIHTDSGFSTVYDLTERKVTTLSLTRVMRIATTS